MAMTMHCDIVSAEKEIYSGPVTMLIATGELGELGITPRHQQLLTRLKPGHIELKVQHKEMAEVFYVSGGFLEVQPHAVTVLADTVERGEDLDEEAARKALEEAERILKDQKEGKEVATAEAMLAQASAQLRIIDELRKKGLMK